MNSDVPRVRRSSLVTVFSRSRSLRTSRTGRTLRPTDNVYEVTLVAKDGTNTTMLDLTVKVTNVEEDDGKVTLAYQQPLIGKCADRQRNRP